MEVLRRAIGFDWYVWVLTDPASEVGADPLALVPDLAELPDLVRLKYLTDANRWTRLEAVGALGGDAGRSPLWSRAQRRHGVADVISAVFRDDFGCWAFLDLWMDRPAAAADLDLLAGLLPTLTGALRRRQALTFAEAAQPQLPAAGAAVVVLDEALRIGGLTPASRSWLARLLPPTGRPDAVPAAALNVAAQLLAREAGVDDHPAQARVHVSHGLWITLKAARLEPAGSIAVSLEPSTPSERLDLFARSHALSARERELLAILAGGADTRQVAGRMFLSEHTVQDHLKSIFTKTGTHNRRTLLSHALGVKAD
ncbi:MAG: helix-turn-helix transcriptional regulator [Propionibacterium sp.]|nr:helix-turn-helix transcriptional regulator [Propionibacterium sp.]